MLLLVLRLPSIGTLTDIAACTEKPRARQSGQRLDPRSKTQKKG